MRQHAPLPLPQLLPEKSLSLPLEGDSDDNQPSVIVTVTTTVPPPWGHGSFTGLF